MKQIGFCHGVLFKTRDVYLEENIDVFKKCGCNAIEINCHSYLEVEKLEGMLSYLEGFDYVSIHLPRDIKYKNDDKTKSLLAKIDDFYMKSGAELAVVHPDLVEDWSVFDDYSINWAIENMDDRKKSFKYYNDLRKFFMEHGQWNLVLDLGHCNANDKTMALADKLISEFKNIIKEIHLSGYEILHDPLYKTKQVEIIKYCGELDVPIIIESIFEESDGVDGVKKEFGYILMNLK